MSKGSTVGIVVKQHSHKVMISVLGVGGDMHCIIHFKLMKKNETITVEVYYQQLEPLRAALLDKHRTTLHWSIVRKC